MVSVIFLANCIITHLNVKVHICSDFFLSLMKLEMEEINYTHYQCNIIKETCIVFLLQCLPIVEASIPFLNYILKIFLIIFFENDCRAKTSFQIAIQFSIFYFIFTKQPNAV